MSTPSPQPALSSVPPEPAGTPPPPLGREIAWSIGAALLITALGLPLGLLWAVLAPDVPVVQGENGPLLTSAQPEQFVAADAWFTFLGIAFGILITVAAWFALGRYRGAIALAAVTLGTIGAALLASWAGGKVGLGEYERLKTTAAIGEHFTKPAELRAGDVHLFLGFLPGIRGDLLAAPLAAAATYTLLAGWSRWPSLRPEPEPSPAFPTPGVAAPAADVAESVAGAAASGPGSPAAEPAASASSPVDPGPGIPAPGTAASSPRASAAASGSGVPAPGAVSDRAVAAAEPVPPLPRPEEPGERDRPGG
ncbi:DUF2567 domain-containing protein [Catenuloplanes atrovinosus]|uniref:DUF2567 domain-containing protein n=1 Tax=Catenuloplanes atrovinosus TaxID=137266 RepID=A0AAE4CCM6_9ACTN|nr:DUF2567 domain-containing protein [Catenuloplanes atrovinosus]MDR7278144.1 hypothetical protein [Catenuloplanes atrovinosus]